MQSNFRGWLPSQLREPAPDCLWQFVGETSFHEPFFEETLGRCRSLPENSFAPPRVTKLDDLPEIARGLETVEPSAFVFHVSRCGSTLVSQLLGIDDRIISLSEVPIFDQLLRARFRPALAAAIDLAAHLTAAIRLHAQRRTGTEESLVIKLDSWHVAFHAELRALYPRTPFILLYRHPAEVVRSQRKRPGLHAVEGLLEPALFGFQPEESTPETRESWLPRVLSIYYDTFLRIARDDPQARLFAYERDMVPVVESIADFAGIELSSSHRQEMRSRASFHGKYPGDSFHGESFEDFPAEILQPCLDHYHVLERRRAAI